jgi:hypothetical protein
MEIAEVDGGAPPPTDLLAHLTEALGRNWVQAQKQLRHQSVRHLGLGHDSSGPGCLATELVRHVDHDLLRWGPHLRICLCVYQN